MNFSIIYRSGPSRARGIAIITVVQSTEFRATEVTSVPLDEEPDNCCTDRITGRRGVASQNCRSDIYESALFSAFLRVVARAQKCFADIQRFAFGGCPPSDRRKGGRERGRRDRKARRREGGRSDEWMKPAVPEARRTRRVILLARVPTTLSSRSRIYTSASSRLRGRGESCFDSRGGSRLVGVMRRIEFIGYALDQAGLRSGIKKGIGMLWDWSNARWIVCGKRDAALPGTAAPSAPAVPSDTIFR